MTIKLLKEVLNDQGEIGEEYYKVTVSGIDYTVVKSFDYGGTLCDVSIDDDIEMEDVFDKKLISELWEENDD